ncbi:PREDICTED: spermatogenesis-associated protein 21-like [Chrysochloris asiatica]|uniref:Spermatogenesis-associated protein 21-like n=1 Tax=Chrysochloris asiatica TaxID=185453 RepID=A0A9B0WQN5_CHRAS|nr:PREDICTED: spermatogenesis-associated protein 21-like [Chrysochloris asiatica]
MDDRNALAYTEGQIKAPEAQPSPSLRTTNKKADVEPTTSETSQAVFPDAPGMDGEKQPSSTPEGSEKGPGWSAVSEEQPLELKTQELRPQEGLGKKQSSWVPNEGPEELQASQGQIKLGNKLELQSPRVSVTSDELQQWGSEEEPKNQQGRRPDPGTMEDQPSGSYQGLESQLALGHQEANGSDMKHSTEPCCTLDSCGQPLGDKSPKEVGTAHIRPQDTLPQPVPREHDEGSSQETMPLVPVVTLEEEMDNPFQPLKPEPETPKGG